MANIRRIHPGQYIQDELESIDMTAKEFSLRTGISERTLSSIITGKGNITFEVADKLAEFFDNTVEFWVNLQVQYDIYLNEKKKNEGIAEDWNYICSIKKYLINNGYLQVNDSKEDAVYKIRKLIGVNGIALLNSSKSFVCFKEQHNKKENDYFYQNFWLALALNEARKKNENEYDKKKLKASIQKIKDMIMLDPNEFYPQLEEILKECGVSFVFIPYLSKSNIYGATKWIGKNNVMLAMSNRNGKADMFWFTLFHELSHVLMEHKRETLYNIVDEEDEEADMMAADMLIPRKDWLEFIKYDTFTISSIKEFASKVRVLPCIVLGRLHKEKGSRVPYGMFDQELSISYIINYDAKNNIQ